MIIMHHASLEQLIRKLAPSSLARCIHYIIGALSESIIFVLLPQQCTSYRVKHFAVDIPHNT